MNASYADEQGDWKRKERREEKRKEQSNSRAKARNHNVNSSCFIQNSEYFEGRMHGGCMASEWRVNNEISL